jgi:hypothetical protein
MPDEWLLYIVANTIDPYGHELPVILSYPPGFSYRARFKTEWVDPVMVENLSTLRGHPCLVVYRHWETGELFPIRYAIVDTAVRYGDVVYLGYELGDTVQYHKQKGRRAEQLSAFRSGFGSEHPNTALTNQPGQHMRPLVFKSKYRPAISNPYEDKDPQNREVESWSNTCEVVSSIPQYAGVDFFRIVRLVEQITEKQVKPSRSRYRLRPGRTYELQVAQQIFNAPGPITPHTLELRCDGHSIQPMTQRRTAVGKYDLLAFRFYTSETSGRRATGFVSLSAPQPVIHGFSVEMEAEVWPEWRFLTSLGAVIGALAVVYPELASEIFGPSAAPSLIQRIGTILFVISFLDSRSIFSQLLRR